jgi:Asp-tRNA(Asn)/Glu-tRNA(Gln) amidotransferase C subunit
MIFREFNYTDEETIHAAKRAAIDLSTTEFSEAETIENIAKCVEQLSQLFMQET